MLLRFVISFLLHGYVRAADGGRQIKLMTDVIAAEIPVPGGVCAVIYF